MAMNLPPVDYQAPQVSPFRSGGLYGAATVQQAPRPARIQGGMNLLPTNCSDGWGQLAPDCPPGEGVDLSGVGPGLGTMFPATVVWASDQCALGPRTDEEARDRSLHILNLKEQVAAEAHVATILPTMAGQALTAEGEKPEDRLADAVGILEAQLASEGIPGALHLPARHVTLAQKAGVLRWQGGQPLTPMGFKWVLGGGYGDLLGSVYATGPVTVLRSEVSATRALSPQSNERLVVAMRELVVGWECLTTAVEYMTQEGV